MYIHNVCNADHKENQHLTADSLKTDCTGQLLVTDCTHHSRDIINHHKRKQCIKQAVTSAKEIAEPSPDCRKYKLYRIPEFLHRLVLL